MYPDNLFSCDYAIGWYSTTRKHLFLYPQGEVRSDKAKKGLPLKQ